MQFNTTGDISDADVYGLNVSPEPFELFEGRTRSRRDPRPSKKSNDGSTAFTDLIKARDRRMRLGSIEGPTHTATLPRMPPLQQPPQSARVPSTQPPLQPQVLPSQTAQQNVSLTNFGLKIPKPRDFDWSGFSRFSGKGDVRGGRR
ncbi:hypothetical protein PHYPSEUDO_014843 [Phytophthora pseudosyringae]|uniref:Uncharacterized protein n=1 Tax=Phytophthora pseudosyringae TaxID=221518 RepID=A0A8T1V8M6_9STRA|nr:hypothetical protein PHYPSEUDO_014843 [Phytophthora pseudosyringae]